MTIGEVIGRAGGTSGGGGAGVASIQEVEITLTNQASNTAAISSVDTANSIIEYNGFRSTLADSDIDDGFIGMELTNATTVTMFSGTTAAQTTIGRCTVVEFTSGLINSIESGSITIAGSATSGTATITSVDTAKSRIIFLGSVNESAVNAVNDVAVTMEFTNATTVTAKREGANGATVCRFMIVEYN